MNAGPSAHQREAGLGMISLVVTLGILGALAAFAWTSTAGSPKAKSGAHSLASSSTGGSSGGEGATPAVPGDVVAQTADLVARDNLTLVLSVADEAAATGVAYGSISAASLSATGSNLQYTSGASSSASEISVRAAGGANGGVTLSVRSASGVCWYIWASSIETWYGAKSGQASCAAVPLPSAPRATTNRTTIRWQPSSFPAA